MAGRSGEMYQHQQSRARGQRDFTKLCHGGTLREGKENICMEGQVLKTSRGTCTVEGWRCRRPKRRFSCGNACVLPKERAGLCPVEGRPPTLCK